MERAKARKTAAIIAATVKRDDLRSRERLPEEAANPYSFLSQEELLELDRLTKAEAARKEQAIGEMLAVATWALSRNDVPADSAACDLIVNYCRQNGVDMRSFAQLGHAFASLVEAGQITPDYSKAAREGHERFAEQLRARGYNVQARNLDANTMSLDELREQVEKDALPMMTQRDYSATDGWGPPTAHNVTTTRQPFPGTTPPQHTREEMYALPLEKLRELAERG